MKKKLRHFTHTDLDGISSSTIAYLYATVQTVDLKSPTKDIYEAEYLDYQDINDRVNRWIDEESYKNENLLISDISVNEETAEKLDRVIKENSDLVVKLLDHHQTADFLNKYDWATVKVSTDTCGTKLVKELLFENDIPILDSFVEAVTLYDNYLHDKDSLCLSKILNYLCYMVDHQTFNEIIVDGLLSQKGNDFIIEDKTLCNIIQQKEIKSNEYAQKKVEDAIIVDDGNYHVAVVFSENNASLIGNKIVDAFGDAIDYAAIINLSDKAIHLRGSDRSPNLGTEIAKPRGGGGHKKAARYPTNLTENEMKELMKILLKGE